MNDHNANVFKNCKSVRFAFNTLKTDCENVLSQVEADSRNETNPLDSVSNCVKTSLLENILNQIKESTIDSEVYFCTIYFKIIGIVSKYCDIIDADNLKLRLIVKRQEEELSWLREDLAKSNKKVQENEMEIVDLNSKISKLEFDRELSSFSYNNEEPPTVKCESCKFNGTNDKMPSKLIPPDKFLNKNMVMSAISSSSKLSEAYNNSGTITPYSPDLQNNMISMIGSTDERRLLSSCHSLVPNKFKTLHRLVIDYTQAKKYDIAISLCQKAIEDLDYNIDGHSKTELAALLNVLAIVYRDKGNHEEAAKVLLEVVAIREATLGKEHPLVAASLNNLSVLYAKSGKYMEAEPLCARALKIRERVLGENHFDVAKQLNNLALLYQGQEKYDLVEYCFKRVLHIYSKTEPPRSPLILRAKTSLEKFGNFLVEVEKKLVDAK